MRSIGLAILLASASLWAGEAVAQKTGKAAEAVASERGRVVPKRVRYGGYFQYLPNREAVGVLVLVHGQPAGEDTQDIPSLAERFVRRWVDFAEQHGLIALAPVFDDENFDSVTGKQGGGYRALYGRQIGADAYVNGIVDAYKSTLGKGWDGRFALYGHSAGGQFASRYAVKYPDRLRAVLISAGGQYAMPEPGVAWPNGMDSLSRTIYWGPNREPQAINVRPSPAGWLKAATVPTTVVVGSLDIEPQTVREGHASLLRTERARQWVDSMNRLADRQRKKGRVSLIVVDGVGHDSARLTPAAQKALDQALAQP